ncbi:hypothetical protein [Citrobacter portucalensis]|uniref:hypothetical protein n=1 Tax=Citrobacter portucalensis TaxID=1639133 RepID=UPI00388F15F4
MKKLINILIITTILLIIVEVLLLIKILLSDIKGFEWISTFAAIGGTTASFGTLYIAWLAYINAPKWFHTKQNEAGFNLVTDIMGEYDLQVLNIQRIYFDVKSINTTNPKFDIVTDQIITHIYETFQLSSKLASLGRWQISYPPSIKDSFDRLSGFYNQAFGILMFRKTAGNAYPDEMITMIDDLKKRILIDSTELKDNIETLFTFNK